MVRKIKDLWLDVSAKKVLPSASSKSKANTLVFELIGAPDDRGVKNVGGRVGACRGPQKIREILSGFSLGIDGNLMRLTLKKGWDVPVGNTISSGHRALRDVVAESVREGIVPIVLGGGHDYGYPHCAGVFDALGKNIALINVDAHLDVRPVIDGKITSGSPFFMAIEEGILHSKNFVEFGIQDHCNDVSLKKYLEKEKVQIFKLQALRAQKISATQQFKKNLDDFSKKKLKTVVSFDLDAVQMAASPGVSSPQVDGFSVEEFLSLVRLSGENPNVVSIGFFEYAPDLDHLQMTGKLVATAIHQYVTAAASRLK